MTLQEKLLAWLNDPGKDAQDNSAWRSVYERTVGRAAETRITFTEAATLAAQVGILAEKEWEPENWLILNDGTCLIYRSDRYDEFGRYWLKAPTVRKSTMKV